MYLGKRVVGGLREMMNNLGFGGYGRIPQNDVNLANMSQAHLVALGQQGNASQGRHERIVSSYPSLQQLK